MPTLIKKKTISRRKKATRTTPQKSTSALAKNKITASYNRIKEHHGKQYTGMQVGRSHKWYYDKGEWKETKVTPDLWRIYYAVTKRRAGKAPEGSGAKVGTGYHWYIVAHQDVLKLNANDYSTILKGLKFKVAHKRADDNKWSAKTPTQRMHLIKFLKEWTKQLEEEAVEIEEFEYAGKTFKGEVVPIPESDYMQFDVTLNDENLGVIRKGKSDWKMDQVTDQKLIDLIGGKILEAYGK
jgi:hypothetical protein